MTILYWPPSRWDAENHGIDYDDGGSAFVVDDEYDDDGYDGFPMDHPLAEMQRTTVKILISMVAVLRLMMIVMLASLKTTRLPRCREPRYSDIDDGDVER